MTPQGGSYSAPCQLQQVVTLNRTLLDGACIHKTDYFCLSGGRAQCPGAANGCAYALSANG